MLSLFPVFTWSPYTILYIFHPFSCVIAISLESGKERESKDKSEKIAKDTWTRQAPKERQRGNRNRNLSIFGYNELTNQPAICVTILSHTHTQTHQSFSYAFTILSLYCKPQEAVIISLSISYPSPSNLPSSAPPSPYSTPGSLSLSPLLTSQVCPPVYPTMSDAHDDLIP